MTVEEMEAKGYTARESAAVMADELEAATMFMMGSMWRVGAETCERQEKIIDRLDRLIALGERGDD